jgi:hypothetical protein
MRRNHEIVLRGREGRRRRRVTKDWQGESLGLRKGLEERPSFKISAAYWPCEPTSPAASMHVCIKRCFPCCAMSKLVFSCFPCRAMSKLVFQGLCALLGSTKCHCIQIELIQLAPQAGWPCCVCLISVEKSIGHAMTISMPYGVILGQAVKNYCA